jgi:hypothetical protein
MFIKSHLLSLAIGIASIAPALTAADAHGFGGHGGGMPVHMPSTPAHVGPSIARAPVTHAPKLGPTTRTRSSRVVSSPSKLGHSPTPQYSSPRSFPVPKIDPASVVNKVTDKPGLGPAANAITNAVTGGVKHPQYQTPAVPGSKVSDAIPKPAPYKTPALPGDKVGQLPSSTPGPLTTPAPKPGDKLADNIHPQNQDPGTPGNPGDNNWPSKTWPSKTWPAGSWPSAPDGLVVSEPAPIVVEQSRVSMRDRVVTFARPVSVIQRAAEAPAQTCASIPQVPRLAAMLDELLSSAQFDAYDLDTVKALRFAIADLDAAGQRKAARTVEERAMGMLGYTKLLFRCSDGSFTWTKQTTSVE